MKFIKTSFKTYKVCDVITLGHGEMEKNAQEYFYWSRGLTAK